MLGWLRTGVRRMSHLYLLVAPGASVSTLLTPTALYFARAFGRVRRVDADEDTLGLKLFHCLVRYA